VKALRVILTDYFLFDTSRANAIGALQVMNIGDNEGLPRRDQLSRFIAGRLPVLQ